MKRVALLLVLVGCEQPAPPVGVARRWLYPPASPAFPLGAITARIGRSQAPQPVASEGITGDLAAPLRLATPWVVPGDGIPRAILYGLEGERQAIEMIEIDRGRVLWRDTTACAAPVVGVTAEAVVCADARGTRAVGLDGKPRWQSDATFIALTDERVVTAGAGESIVVDAATGSELARVKLPATVTSDSIIASCGDAGRELFAIGQSGKLARIAEAQGGPKLTWSVPVGATVSGIEACDGDSVLVTASTESGTALISIARATGKVTGRIDRVRGYWPARDGAERLEIATDAGVASWPRDLAGTPAPLVLPPLGELLAKRADRRLVRATPLTAALLDRHGVRAYLPLAEMGAVLGDDMIVAASWLGSPGETPHRIAIPQPWRRPLRVVRRGAPVGVPAELRDLPAVVALDTSHAIARAGAAMHSVAAVALDPTATNVYAVALEQAPDDAHAAGVARFDLATQAWRWLRADGCGAGTPIAIAVAREIVVCAGRGAKSAAVRASSRDGEPRWTWTGDNVDGVDAAADIVLVYDAARMAVLDAGDGALLATIASDDGAAVRAAALDVDGMAMVVTYERGRVVARLPHVDMVPAWTIAVDGVVRALSRSGDGVVVELEDGDAVRIDARTGAAIALPGLDLVWRAAGDLVTGQAAGGSVPPAKMPIAPLVIPRPVPVRDVPENPPPIATPWPAVVGLADSWQLTLYELAGGVRARNDYALAPPIAPAAARGPGASPLVVEYGPGLRELVVIDPHQGTPLRRRSLPEDAPAGLTFATIVDGKPVAGTILAAPLRVVVF